MRRFANKNQDGYIYSKTVKGLSEHEKEWVLLESGFKTKRDRDGKILYRYKSCVDKFPYTIKLEHKTVKIEFTEKRLLTYNPDLARKKAYEISKLVEKAKNLTASKAKKDDCGEAGKYLKFTGTDGNKAIISLNQEAIDKDLKFAGYNLIVTSETNMSDNAIYAAYHNLWRIEESFRTMKSDLDARPVFLQKENTIKGHFLICYIAVLLERIFQFIILKNKYSTHEIFNFIKNFKFAKCTSEYLNLTSDSKFIIELEKEFGLNMRNIYLNANQIKKIINYRLQ